MGRGGFLQRLCLRQIVSGGGIIRLKPQGLLVLCYGLGNPACLLQGGAHIAIGLDIVRFEPQRRSVMGQCLHGTIRGKEGSAQAGLGNVVATDMGGPGGQPPRRGRRSCQVAVSSGAPRLAGCLLAVKLEE